MKERYIAPAIMLVAGAITSILNIVNGTEFLKGLERLLAVLILFYIIGRIAAAVIKKATSPNKNSADSSVQEEKTEESTELNSQTEEQLIAEDTAETENQ